VEKLWLPHNDNINLKKYTQILDANLRPFYCRRFRGKTFVFKYDMHRQLLTTFHESFKLKIIFPARPGQPGLQTWM